MKILLLLVLSGVAQSVYAADEIANNSTSISPLGALPARSKVSLEPADPKNTYFTSTSQNGATAFEEIAGNSLYRVKSFTSTEPNTADTADLQALVRENALMMHKSDLTNAAANCQTSKDLTQCTLNSDVPVYSSGIFDFFSFFTRMLNPMNWFRALRGNEPKTDKDIAQAMTDTIDRANSLTSGNGKNLSEDCPSIDKALESRLTAALKGDKNLKCGVHQALDAYQKNQSQIQSDVLIFNDFSDGGRVGKMWFLNRDGSPAKVLNQNPIPVSRGKGGFGSGIGSLKTPHGAVLTKSYSPPRSGNIRDGVELVGLEEANKDIHRRGILLHGGDPYSETWGCLGVAGQIDTRARGRRQRGSPPPYLDQLKKGILKEGGVLIYNFTPTKKNLCKNSL